MNHFLVLFWAEQDEGTFTDELDWMVSHPPSCGKDDGAFGWSYDCAIQWELEHVGVESFGRDNAERQRAWGSHPCAFPIEHFHEEIRIGFSTEHETGIRMIA